MQVPQQLTEKPHESGLIVGKDETGEYLVQIYWIIGPDEKVLNPVFCYDGVDRLFVKRANPRKGTPGIVSAMCSVAHHGLDRAHIVGNGEQVEDIATRAHIDSLQKVIGVCTHHSKAFGVTTCITAISSWSGETSHAEMSFIRMSPAEKTYQNLLYEVGDLDSGSGYRITTYSEDGTLYRVPLVGDITQIAESYWEELNVDDRVSLAVKFIPRKKRCRIVIQPRRAV